jgi:hypothetical protein
LWGGVAVAAIAAGCGSPCEDLASQCGDCPASDPVSAGIEAQCDATVEHGDYDTCQAALGTAPYTCPR